MIASEARHAVCQYHATVRKSRLMEDGFVQAHRTALWKSIVFIQNHLDTPLSLERIAKESGYAAYHFHRLFRRFTGDTVKAYVRRLRLEEAAFRLRVSSSQIVDVALDSGFFTHETFTRAFYKRFGKNPSEYRETRPANRSDIWITSVRKVYFIGRACIFKRYQGPYENSGTPEETNSLWRQLIGYLPNKDRTVTDFELFGICRDDPSITDSSHIRYDACVAVPQDYDTHCLTCRIPEGFYVQAIHTGPFHELTRSYHYLIHEWPSFVSTANQPQNSALRTIPHDPV